MDNLNPGETFSRNDRTYIVRYITKFFDEWYQKWKLKIETYEIIDGGIVVGVAV